MASSTMEEPKLPGGYLVTPRVPQGLAAAVEGLTREVIRHSPEDIYVFAAHHFEKLLELRERCGGEVTTAPSARDAESLRTLREMSRALRAAREVERGNARNPSDQVGWSLNQTAKVLKRHRSIFGEAGRRISTDEVFRMANQKEARSRAPKQPAARSGSRENAGRKERDAWRASTSRTSERSNEESHELTPETQRSAGPRIITTIPSLQSSTHSLLAKDIKTELRRNRISSRERRAARAKPEDRGDVKTVPGKPSAPRKSSDRPRRPESDKETRNRRSLEASRSSEGHEEVKSPPPQSMDKVKDYVVNRFATTRSLEELQTLNYVEKVQEIIDETGPIIKGKVDQLKSGMIGRSKRSSWFADPKNDLPKTSPKTAERTENVVTSETPEGHQVSADALRTRLTETQNLLENVSSRMSRPRRSRSARGSRGSLTTNEDVFMVSKDPEDQTTLNRDLGLERRLSKTRSLLEDISSTLSRPMRRSSSAKNLRRSDEDDFGDSGSRDALKSRLDETRDLLEGISATFGAHRVGSAKGRRGRTGGSHLTEDASLSDSPSASKVSLPAVRSASAKSSSGSVSRSDSDNLVLPSISPEAPRTRRVKRDLVLPVLSPAGSGSSAEASKIEDADVKDEEIEEIPVEEVIVIPEAEVEDVFRDSLNVTPDLDSIPQRPDSLEPVESGEDSPKVDDLRGRLREIRKVEKEIERVFSGSKSSEAEDSGVRRKLREVEEAEDSGVRRELREVEEAEDSGMRRKLREVEEAEKRIQRIFEGEDREEDEGSKDSEAKEGLAEVDKEEEVGSCEEEIAGIEGRNEADGSGDGSEDRGRDEDKKGDEGAMVKSSAASPEVLNYTYVLTEGSPYEIPDSVTTVIIPERTVESPVSDRLEDGLVARLLLDSAEAVRKEAEGVEGIGGKAIEDIEEIDEKAIEDIEGIEEKVIEDIEGIDKKVIEDIEEIDEKAIEDIEEIDERIIEVEDLKATEVDSNRSEASQPDVESIKNESSSKEDYLALKPDPFGEVVEPEPVDMDSPDLDYICDVNGRQELHMTHQDLASINEEIAEEGEEGLEETVDVIKETESIEAVEEKKNEDRAEVSVDPDNRVTEEEKKDSESGDEKVEEVSSSPDSPMIKEENEDNEDDKLEEVPSSPDSPMTKEEKEDNEDKKVEEVPSSPDSPMTKEEKEDNEDEEVEGNEVIQTPETTDSVVEIKKEDTKEAAGDSDGPTTKEENEDMKEATDADMETKNEDKEEVISSPKSPKTEEEKEDNEDNKVEVKETPKTPETIETALETKEKEVEEASSSPDIQEIQENNEAQKTEAGKSKSRTESELSPEAARLYLDSESSNEAKESSGPDELLESAKCANSADDEDSSATRSPESSNEVKETTLTDGLSLSLDPTRPFVPELNLDSLQDITVSSFKMTEDEYDNQGPAESANTNSITETLTSDENRRLMENAEYVEEAVLEHLTSSSDASKLEEAVVGLEEIVEEPIVKSQVEIKEDICVKGVAHITGSNSEEEKEEKEENGEEGEKEEIQSTTENEESVRVKREIPTEREKVENPGTEVDEVAEEGEAREATEEESEAKSVSPEAKEIEEIKEDDSESLKVRESASPEVKEIEEIKEDDSESPKVPESASPEVKENEEIKEDDSESPEASKSASPEAKENEQVKEDDSEILEVSKSASLEIKKEEEIKEDDSKSLEASKSASPEVKKNEEIKEDDSESLETNKSASLEMKKEEEIKEDDSEILEANKSATLEVKKKEEIKEDDSESLEATVVEDRTTKEPLSVDLSGEIRSVEDGSDEMAEENFVEEETPLAVSRSASQCTTRRVSSGNLAKLREDPILGWTEETEREIGNEDEANSAKLKFSKIGGQTIREQGSDEVELSQDSASPENGSEDTREIRAKDSKEYHIYVPDVDASEDNSTTESSTVDSAVTKIQARVRGFLTRRRMHRGQHNRSSTLSSIPSIQDSVAVEPSEVNGEQPNEVTESATTTLDDPGLENAATRIQSNYRGYQARKRLRREDAVQRTTLSLEKSFADSGLQHTGEFHDCIALPIHDVTLGKKFPTTEKTSSDFSATEEISSKVKNPENSQGDLDEPQGHLDEPQGHEALQGHRDLGNMFFGQSSSNVPLIQFGLAPKIERLVDLVILAKEEANLESGYLNFITSVEDAEAVNPEPVARPGGTELFVEGNSSESLKEPLALSAPPMGVVIEEVTSSDFEAPAKSPEASTESSGSPRAPRASSETISGSTEESRPEDVDLGNQTTLKTPRDEGHPGSLVKMSTEDFGITTEFLLPREIDLLGPESSVDSIECPVVVAEDRKKSSGSSGDAEEPKVAGDVGECLEEEKDSSAGTKIVEEDVKEEEPFLSNVDEASSTLSFSLKVEDFLGLGAEDSAEFQGRKPILEVTLTPGDIMKSMSLSQESQLAGERIESPVTMVQMAPGRSESLQLDEDEETAGKQVVSPGAAKSGRKNS